MAVTKLNTKEEFTAALNGQGDKLIVVDFTATWCGPCRNIAPKFELMAKDYKEVAVFFKVDVDENDEVAEEEGIQAMPTFKFYKHGSPVGKEKVVGGNEAALKAKIDAVLKLK